MTAVTNGSAMRGGLAAMCRMSAAWLLRDGWSGLPLAAAGIGAGAAMILCGVGLMATSGYLISRAAERPPLLDLMVVIVAVRFFGLARPALRYAERLVSHDVTFRLLRRIRRAFVDALAPLAPAVGLRFRSGDLLARLAGDVDSLQEIHLRLVSPALIATIVSTLVIAALTRIDARLAFAVLGLLVLQAVGWPFAVRRLARGTGASRNRERTAIGQRLVPLLQGLEDLQAFGGDDREVQRLLAHQRALEATERRDAGLSAFNATAVSLFPQLALWSALALLAPLAASGRIPTPWIAAIALGIVSAFEAVEGLPAAWQRSEQIGDAARRVLAVIDEQPAVADAPDAVDARAADRAPAFHVRHLTFAHTDAPVLRDLSFDLSPGEQVAIVGPSGSGKSTLLSLLVRTWDPTTGEITLADLPLPRWRLSALRAAIALMPQQAYVFDTTLRENVRLPQPSASDEAIREALRQAALGPFLDSLPGGLDAPLGEHGSRMSAGERQRLGLARLLLSSGSVWLLDEPTANLDAVTARHVLATVRQAARGRTLVLATHRLDDLDAFDRILVFDRGRIVESGAHAALVARGGLYARMLDVQRDRVADAVGDAT